MRGWWMAFGFLMMPLFALGQAYIDTVEAYAVFKACYRRTFLQPRPRYVEEMGRAYLPDTYRPAGNDSARRLQDGQILYTSDFMIRWNSQKLRKRRFVSSPQARAMTKMARLVFEAGFAKSVNPDSMEAWKAIAGENRKMGTLITISCPVFLNSQECIVSVSAYHGPLHGIYETLHLRKKRGRWRVYHSRGMSA